MESVIGRNIADFIIKENKLTLDGAKLSYLRRVGGRISRVCSRSGLTYHFYIIDEDGFDAFSLPGGYIFLSKGLVDDTSEGELAFCLAHEIAHICSRDGLKQLRDLLGPGAVLSLSSPGANNALIKRAADIVYNAVALGYSTRQELAADSLAVEYIYKAGYNPSAGISLLKKIKNNSVNQHSLIFLRSHPPVTERIKNIEEKIHQLD